MVAERCGGAALTEVDHDDSIAVEQVAEGVEGEVLRLVAEGSGRRVDATLLITAGGGGVTGLGSGHGCSCRSAGCCSAVANARARANLCHEGCRVSAPPAARLPLCPLSTRRAVGRSKVPTARLARGEHVTRVGEALTLRRPRLARGRRVRRDAAAARCRHRRRLRRRRINAEQPAPCLRSLARLMNRRLDLANDVALVGGEMPARRGESRRPHVSSVGRTV